MSYKKIRNCPKCQKKLIYSSYHSWYISNKNNCLCLSCAKKGKSNGRLGKKHNLETIEKIRLSNIGKHIVSDKTRKRLSIARRKRKVTLETRNKMKGHIPWNKGKHHSKETIERIKAKLKTHPGWTKESHHSIETIKKMKNKIVTEGTKYKSRLSAIKRIRKQGFLISYNPSACKFIDELNKGKGWNLQHALNGGEIELYGYFVDGYDKERNIIFEYDESDHYKVDGSLKQKDTLRQKRIIDNIKPSMFIRYDEKNKKLYDVKTNQILSIYNKI